MTAILIGFKVCFTDFSYPGSRSVLELDPQKAYKN